ncbi:MCE family protein [Nocardia arizonensis]|uniref:MCE family protein n=1 Tax=Nocardia arizonensis TaxID=1141647 RepID=UPI000B1C113B|nr:MCE family protein [Nocardia arizonensis]
MSATYGAAGALTRIFEPPAGLVLTAVRVARRRRLGLSAVALALAFVLGVTYLVFGALDMDPTAETYTVKVHLAQSGGLLPGQDVTLRGVPVGRVASIDLTADGLVAIASIDAARRIPASGEVRVSGLSPAGEQYLDFRPNTDDAPYLSDGDQIAIDRTSSPTQLYQLLGDLDDTLAQIDPAKLAAVIDELGIGPQGPRKLVDIVDGGVFLLSTMDTVLPQTVSLLRDSRTVLTTLGDMSPGLRAAAGDAEAVFTGIEAKDGGFRTLLGTGPGAMHSVDALIADNSPTMVQLLGNLATVAQLAYVRVPAFHEFFFPTFRDGSTLEAISTVFHDGGLWGLVNIYPRYACDYPLPRSAPSQPNFPEPHLYTYCANNDPSVLIRGARNAPRPADDDTAGPPQGVDPDARSSQTPTGPFTLPLPYGGPEPSTQPR